MDSNTARYASTQQSARSTGVWALKQASRCLLNLGRPVPSLGEFPQHRRQPRQLPTKRRCGVKIEHSRGKTTWDLSRKHVHTDRAKRPSLLRNKIKKKKTGQKNTRHLQLKALALPRPPTPEPASRELAPSRGQVSPGPTATRAPGSPEPDPRGSVSLEPPEQQQQQQQQQQTWGEVYGLVSRDFGGTQGRAGVGAGTPGA